MINIDVYLVSCFSVKVRNLISVALFALLAEFLRDQDFAPLFVLVVPVKQKQ
jgi:hypothetical protein